MSTMSSFFTRSAGLMALALLTGACGSSTSSPLAPSTPLAAAPADRGALGLGGASTASEHTSHSGEAEVEFRGTVESITPPTLMVGGRLVTTDSATLILRDDVVITLADLRLGELVEVEGSSLGAGTLASKIKVEDAADDEVEFRGTIDSITPPTLQVAGRPVTTDSQTRILRGNTPIVLTDLRAGELVEVEGSPIPGSVLASKIKVEDEGDDDSGHGGSGSGGSGDDGGHHGSGGGDDDDDGDDGGSHGGGNSGSGGGNSGSGSGN